MQSSSVGCGNRTDASSTRTADLGRLADWSDPDQRFAYYPLQMIAGYANAIEISDLSAGEKRRCLLSVAAKLRSPMKLLRGR